MRHRLLVMLALLSAAPAVAAPYALTLPAPAAPTPAAAFHLGTPTSPAAPALTVNGSSLLRGGAPILPVMGEFHYSRYDPADWRTELLKMKAGGITVVSTYVFWIHHEETEGHWDWTGARDLRQFAQTCKDVGLPLIVRIGPWDHGEVRNGGFPDWLLDKKLKLRSEDPAFLHEVQLLYAQIAQQLDGLLYKDGGPVIGVQVDNEFRGHASYLLALKKLARDQGLDVPYYTRTGWPTLTTPIPFGEILPLYGAYAEGFWDRSLDAMPGAYWRAFTFAAERTDSAVGTDFLGNRARSDEARAYQYPYLTCELGGGMMTSYHRRIHIDPRDAFALEIAKLGSGSNLPGFYMYHGGANPDAHNPALTLQETQSTRMTNYNDMPVKTYDFQAPLGEFGQIRESYHLLRRTQLFLHDWQETLAPMPAIFPADRPGQKNDATTLRWAVRSDGHAGFVFINNYQRGLDMPAKPNVQFSFTLADGSTLSVPSAPITVPGDTAFFLPFNMPLGGGTLLSYATAQPVCRITNGDTTSMVFAEIPGIPAEFSFPENAALAGPMNSPVNAIRHDNHQQTLSNIAASLTPFVTLRAGSKTTRLILVDHDTSLRIWRATVAGEERILITPPGETLFTDGSSLTLQTTTPALGAFSLTAIPPLETQPALPRPLAAPATPAVTFEQIQKAGPVREIRMGVNKAALEPTDADFAGAEPAVYRIRFSAGIDPGRDLLLRAHYDGDVARFYLDGKLIDDNFYNGTPFDLGLKRFGPAIYSKELLLKILPLQKNAPIYIQKEDQPDFHGASAIEKLRSLDLIETFSTTLQAR